MNIIVAGIGKVGKTLAEQLVIEGHSLTLIDLDSEILNNCVEQYDLLGVSGNCASMETLKQAEVEKANLLIASSGSDEVNLLTCLTAHGMNPKLHTIARIRNPEYMEQAYTMRDMFALSVIFNPERQTALEIERLLKYPGFLKRDSFAKGRVEIVELRIEKDSKLSGVTLNQLYDIVKCKVLVCAVARNGETYTPDGHFKLEIGDRIWVTAPSDALSVLLKSLGIVTHKVRRVILLGGGTVSYYLAQLLEGSHLDVEIVEKNLDICQRLSELLPHTQITHGDVTDQTLLESIGISECDALISLTGLDELNMILSLYGNNIGIPKVITKISREEDSKITDGLSIGSVVCPRKLCCNTIVRYVRAMQNQSGAAITMHTIAEGRAEALEFLVDEHTENCGIPLKKIRMKPNVLLVSITRHGKIEIPSGDSSFMRGDNIVVVSSGDATISNLNDIFA